MQTLHIGSNCTQNPTPQATCNIMDYPHCIFHSLPITACWYIGNYSSSTGLVDSQQATRAQTCNWLYNSQELEFSKTFKDSGIFTLAATFNNSASADSGNFSFVVVAGKSDTVHIVHEWLFT